MKITEYPVMPTRYSEELMDWFGIMDEAQFYAESGRSNRRFFRRLIAAWTKKAGCFLEWGVGGVSLCARIDGKKVEACSLAPQCQLAHTRDHIMLTRATCLQRTDKDRAERREQQICAAAGSLAEIGSTRIDIAEPGSLSRENQETLIQALVDFP
jgi:hypothetical protein